MLSAGERRLQALRENGQAQKERARRFAGDGLKGGRSSRPSGAKSWCDNLERYSDFANRLPRGRTYVRNGSVIDLQISSGEIKALSAVRIYEVAVRVRPRHEGGAGGPFVKDCAGR